MKKIIKILVQCINSIVPQKYSRNKAAAFHSQVKKSSLFTISSASSSASLDIYRTLDNLIDKNIPLSNIIILCIGTDRATGDALGPIVGKNLKELFPYEPLILGTLESPVHGKNLDITTENIYKLVPHGYIIAIDACLGSISSIGDIHIESGPLYPGSALNKSLSPVGDVSITAVVNSLAGNSFSILQSTRLFTVMSIADIICSGLVRFIVSRETYQNKDE